MLIDLKFVKDVEKCLAVLDPVFAYIIHKGYPIALWHNFLLLSVNTYVVLYNEKVLSSHMLQKPLLSGINSSRRLFIIKDLSALWFQLKH